MQQVTRIPLWRTFLNWIISVIVGSILWPVIMSVFESGPNGIDDIGGVILISGVFSGLTSLPAMLILLVVNWQLNKHELPRARYHGIHAALHVGVALLTFFVIYLFTGNLGKEFFPFIVLGTTYTVVGITTWFVTFRIYRNKEVNRTGLREDILDEL
jgi:hypothetical protein